MAGPFAGALAGLPLLPLCGDESGQQLVPAPSARVRPKRVQIKPTEIYSTRKPYPRRPNPIKSLCAPTLRVSRAESAALIVSFLNGHLAFRTPQILYLLGCAIRVRNSPLRRLSLLNQYECCDFLPLGFSTRSTNRSKTSSGPQRRLRGARRCDYKLLLPVECFEAFMSPLAEAD